MQRVWFGERCSHRSLASVVLLGRHSLGGSGATSLRQRRWVGGLSARASAFCRLLAGLRVAVKPVCLSRSQASCVDPMVCCAVQHQPLRRSDGRRLNSYVERATTVRGEAARDGQYGA